MKLNLGKKINRPVCGHSNYTRETEQKHAFILLLIMIKAMEENSNAIYENYRNYNVLHFVI